MAKRPDDGHEALRRGRMSLPHHVYSITATTLLRRRWFSHFPVACAAARTFERPGVLGDSTLIAWVLMPDHAHWLLQLGARDGLADVMCRMKSSSARSVNRAAGRTGQVWASAYHDRALRRDEDVRACARYIIGNPVRAGLVETVADYPFWNAVWV